MVPPERTIVVGNTQGGSITLPNIGGGIGGIGVPSGNVNTTAPQAPDMPGSSPRGPGSDKPGQSYSDTVTGTAGSAAGPAAKTMKDWFNDTFR